MKILFITNTANGSAYYRAYLPCKYLKERKHLCDIDIDDFSVLPSQSKRKITPTISYLLDNADIVVFQAPVEETRLALMYTLKNKGKKIVIDYDDTMKIEKDHPVYKYKKDPIVLWNILMLADLITVSTPCLKEEFDGFVKGLKPVLIWRNHIEIQDFPVFPKHKKPRVLLSSSVARMGDFQIVLPLLEEFQDKVDFVVIGAGYWEKYNPYLKKIFKVNVPYTPVFDYLPTMNSLGVDFSLIPREVDYWFNKTKSAVKLLENWLLKIPTICSPMDEYVFVAKHNKNVLFAKTLEEWRKYFLLLLNNPEKREKLAFNGYEEVKKKWDIRKGIKKLEKYFNLLIHKPKKLYDLSYKSTNYKRAKREVLSKEIKNDKTPQRKETSQVFLR